MGVKGQGMFSRCILHPGRFPPASGPGICRPGRAPTLSFAMPSWSSFDLNFMRFRAEASSHMGVEPLISRRQGIVGPSRMPSALSCSNTSPGARAMPL